MSLRGVIRKKLVDQLPASTRLFLERQYFGRYLAQEKRLFRTLCDANRTSVDVGANKGDMALFLSQYSSEVHAFEPVPQMAAMLRRRFNNCNVRIYDCALGASRTRGTLRIPSVGSEVYTTRATLLHDVEAVSIYGKRSTTCREITVPIATLDDFNLGHVGVIKIDVEGYELDVLEGATRTIRNNQPAMYIEIEQRRHGARLGEIFRKIESLGYAGWFLQRSRLCPIAEFNTEAMQNPKLEGTPDFVNNFVFTPIKRFEPAGFNFDSRI